MFKTEYFRDKSGVRCTSCQL